MAGPTPNKTVKRYRINPLELIIFTIVSAGFVFSVYHLFRQSDEFQFATLQPMQTQPNRKVPNRAIAGRVPEGVVDGVAPTAHRIDFEVNCAENPGFQFGEQNCPKTPVGGRELPDSSKYNPAK